MIFSVLEQKRGVRQGERSVKKNTEEGEKSKGKGSVG